MRRALLTLLAACAGEPGQPDPSTTSPVVDDALYQFVNGAQDWRACDATTESGIRGGTTFRFAYVDASTRALKWCDRQDCYFTEFWLQMAPEGGALSASIPSTGDAPPYEGSGCLLQLAEVFVTALSPTAVHLEQHVYHLVGYTGACTNENAPLAKTDGTCWMAESWDAEIVEGAL